MSLTVQLQHEQGRTAVQDTPTGSSSILKIAAEVDLFPVSCQKEKTKVQMTVTLLSCSVNTDVQGPLSHLAIGNSLFGSWLSSVDCTQQTGKLICYVQQLLQVS